MTWLHEVVLVPWAEVALVVVVLVEAVLMVQRVLVVPMVALEHSRGLVGSEAVVRPSSSEEVGPVRDAGQGERHNYFPPPRWTTHVC